MANVDIQIGYKNSAWFTANATLVLKIGQVVYLEQTGTYKIGDGITQLSALLFLGTGSFVPYTGATSDVNLGEFGVQLGNLEFDNTPTNIPTNAGSLVWNDTDGTLDLKLKGGNVTLQIGQETVIRVVNKTATNVTLLQSNYQAVRITGAQGQRPKVDLAQATNDILSAETIGLVTETIANNEEGFINTSGLVRGINTTGSLQGETWADGDIIYLSPTIAGNVTNIKPIAPNHLIIIGYVISAHITQGTIFVKVDNGYELDELHNVSVNSLTLANNDVLTYESSSQLWKNKQVISQTIINGVTDKSPSEDAVFDALALKKDTITLVSLQGLSSPADLTTYYFWQGYAPSTTDSFHYFKIGYNYKVKGAIIITSTAGNSGTGENNTINFWNATTATSSLISSTVRTNVTSIAIATQTVTGLNITGSANDNVCIQWITPNYSANPTSVLVRINLFIEITY